MENTAEYRVYENQSWLDISNILYGNPSFAYDLAEANHSTITAEVLAGQVIKYNKNITANKLILHSLSSNKSIPATAISQWQTANSEKPQGISYWAIGINFIIS